MPTTSSARVRVPAVLVIVGAGAFLTGLVGLAGPAAAMEDPRRPTAEVTHGPSCGPSVVRVAVTNGSEPHGLALVFDGAAEQDSVVLAAGEQAELTSADVDWARTVDVVVSVTGADGTAQEPIELGTYTRPSAEDCAAVTAPSTPSGSTSADPAVPVPTTSTPAPPTSSGPAPTAPADTSATTAGPAPDERTSGRAGSSSSASVSPGGVVTLRGGGFTPGEPVTVTLVGVDDPLATVAAAVDGSVEAVVQIPRGAALGTATVQLVGGVSAATTGLDLQVAAREQFLPPPTTTTPGLAAGATLIGTAGCLGLMAARRSREHHPSTPR